MISVTILGSGAVAQNIYNALEASTGFRVTQVVGRHPDSLVFFKDRAVICSYNDDLLASDVYIIAVSDDAIAQVAAGLVANGLVVHTSGAMSLDVLAPHQRTGVLYPLQTFTKNRILNFKTIPICIEASEAKDLVLLEKLANCLSDTVQVIHSEQRKALHVAAVFANNFTTYMCSVSATICKENGLDFKLMQPLINETANKIGSLGPEAAQTGPAKRGDLKTLHAHLGFLKSTYFREIYTLLSNSIKVFYNKNISIKNQ